MNKKLVSMTGVVAALIGLLSGCSRTVPEPGGYYITQINPTNSYATGSLLGYRIKLHINKATGVYSRWKNKTATIYFTWGQEYHIYSKYQIGTLVNKGVYQYKLSYKHTNFATIYFPTDKNLTINLTFNAARRGTFNAIYNNNSKDTMVGTFDLDKGQP